MSTSDSSSVRRVLMTADTIGGVWTYAVELCRGLAEHDVEVILATMGAPARPEQRHEAVALRNVLLCESAYRLEWMDAPWSDVRAAGDWLLKLEQRFEPDVIHLNGYAHAALPWSAPALTVAHSCVLSWWRAVKGADAPPEWERYARAVRTGLHAAQAIVAPSRWMAGALDHHYGPLPAAPRIIANGRVLPPHLPPEKEPFVLCIGRLWDEAKNAHLLAQVAPDLPWPVCLVGECCSPKGEHAALPNVELLGHQPAREVASLCGRAMIFASPARYEPFGLSVLEAASAHCALVLGDIPSLRETWDGAALFVPPDDVDALRAALQELIARPGRIDQLGASARQRALQFTAERMTGAYLELYRELRRGAHARSAPPPPDVHENLPVLSFSSL